MELKEIQDLIKFVAKSGVSEVELESKGFKIVIKTGNGNDAYRGETTVIHAAAPLAAPIAMPVAPAPVIAAAPSSPAPAVSNESKYIAIKSPMIGTFYRSAGPGKPVFVNVGDEIKPGKTTCIIEAMKLFNEIESEVSGKIVKVLVEDSSPVEYDQPLFLVDPS
ncbi:MAG TPA: acetyl-CoA carboxylase biotin carboxyl carrier protein [Bacteroidia bacterium]|nr:acetyl-CoA carboxylase biotin carboxyl carrier protein [Bacteroidia bacterium]HRH08838.1 acetyl-CoA carboxylase biotin carboxyl carrier protein [Bacteroidia bacterium]